MIRVISLTLGLFLWLSPDFLYSQCVSDPVTNLVNNGSFSGGRTGFVSGYSSCTTSNCLYPEGYYAVGTNANFYHNNFVGRDHTSGTGNFMIVNGAGVANTIVWQQTITVKPGVDYNFSSWVMSLVAGSPARLQFSINGTPIGAIFNAPAAVNVWQNFANTWNSGTNTSAVITILNQNTTLSGNDFGIDDISFVEICATPIPNLGADRTLCGVGTILLNSNVASTTTMSVTWNDGTTGTGLAAPYTKTINAPGKYWVCVKDGPCVKTDTINITADFSINIGPDFTLCATTVFMLDAGYTNGTTSYKWYKDNTLIPDSTNRTFWVRSPGVYRVEVFDGSCGTTRTDEVSVGSTSAIPVDAQYCSPGPAIFEVIPNPTGGFKWYDAPVGGTVVGKGNSISVSGTGKMTMYAEDTSAFQYNVGPTSKFPNGFAAYSNTDEIEFDAHTSFTLDAVTVWAKLYNPNENYTVGVKVYDQAGTLVASIVKPVTGPPIVPVGNDWPFTVTLGFNIPAGNSYKITNEGTVGELFWASGGANVVDWNNYKVPGVITLKGVPDWSHCSATCYGFFYNWQISKGKNCARTPVVATENCPTPVHWSDFTVTKKSSGNDLKWQTTWEHNTSHFLVQRSLDGQLFETIGNVKAAGSSDVAKSYQYEDTDYKYGQIYYRIVEIDLDQSRTSTGVLWVERNYSDVSMYPNPTAGEVFLKVGTSNSVGTLRVTVSNSLGQELLAKSISGELTDPIDISELPIGVYLINVEGDEVNYTDKIVKH